MPNVPLPQRISTCGSLRCQETMGVPLLRLGLRGQGSSFGDKLKADKESIWYCYTKLIMKVKKLEKNVRSNQARRKTKIIVSDDEEDSEDSSKQGRMIEDINHDARITLVTPTKVSSQEYQLEDQLGVLSVAKVIVDAAKKKVNTYTKRRRAVSIGSERVNTASRIFSTAEESVSTAGESMPMCLDEELAQKLYEVEQARFNAEQEAKFNEEQEELLESETTKDEANPSVTDQRKTMCTYMKNMVGYKAEHFKGKSFYEAKEMFDNVYKQVTSFVPMESCLESTKEPKADEISQEDLQQMLMIVPVEEVYVEALKVKYLIIDWEVYIKDSRKYWKIIRVGNHTEAYQTFVDMLKRFDRDDLVML
nr:hypothetical protein [Tanacetum cinerariifolium]